MADTTVTLDIRNWVSNDPGWKETTGKTGYSYLFSGGNAADPGNPGGFVFSHGPGNPNSAKSVDISLIADSRYRITAVDVVYDRRADGTEPPPDIVTGNPGAQRTWTITDTDVDAESGYFRVTVSFGADQGMVCDPRWINN